jgi:hypothetical protein
LGEGKEVVVVRVPADGGNVRRVRGAVATVGDLGDEGSGLLGRRVPTELGTLQNPGQLGQESGTDGDLETLVDHRPPKVSWVALRGNESGHEHGRVEDDPLHYEAALPESLRSRRIALSSS